MNSTQNSPEVGDCPGAACSARIARLEDLVCLASTCLNMLEGYLGPQWFEAVANMDLVAPDVLAAECSEIIQRRQNVPALAQSGGEKLPTKEKTNE